MNEQNLKPVKCHKEAVKRGRAGGIASAEAKRERKAIRDTLEAILCMTLKKGDVASVEEIQAFAEAKKTNLTVQEAIAVNIVQKALSGDIKAAEFIRDMVGERPDSKLAVSGNVPVVIVDDVRE